MLKWYVRTAVAALIVAGMVRLGAAQDICRGDLDGNSQITGSDVDLLVRFLFVTSDVDPTQAMRADANDDGAVTIADVSAIILDLGAQCSQPSVTPTGTPTPSRTPTSGTGTPTPTRTITLTPTRPPTPTPTQMCSVQVAQFGMVSGSLTSNDCLRTFGQRQRYTDLYTIIGTPGEAIKVTVTSTAFVPYVQVVDADGQFGRIESHPPIEFVVSSNQPYQILVSSEPASAEQLGAYTLELSRRTCPATQRLSTSFVGTFAATDCPDPGFPSVAGRLNPADTYEFTVAQNEIPKNISIKMFVTADSRVDPSFVVFGPDGYQIVVADEDSLEGPSGSDELVRFLALQPGTYTIIATGGGGLDRYTIRLEAPTCRRSPLTSIPSTSALSVSGRFFGRMGSGPSSTGCGAPLPLPGNEDEVPEPNSPADLYTFTAAAGDVISVEMESEDDPQLFLIGPTTCPTGDTTCVPNQVIATDDESGAVSAGSAHLAATLVRAGTYIIIPANNIALLGPDPEDPEDPGETVDYMMFVQKCPVSGAVSSNGTPVTAAFDGFTCTGFGGVPFRTYAMNGTAGQFVTATVTSDTFDAFVRIFAPDGSQVSNDNDQFLPLSSNARANRILPMTGTYFVEVSSSIDQGGLDLPTQPPYQLRVRTCGTTAATPGNVAGSFDEADCAIADGRRFDVYTIDRTSGPSNGEAGSIVPPANTCIVGLFVEGVQVPADICSPGPLDLPMVQSGLYGFMVAAAAPATRGGYTTQFSRCPLESVGFGEVRQGTLTATDCAAADGARADWYLIRAPLGRVVFNGNGAFGEIQASFPLTTVLTDLFGSFTASSTGNFSDDADLMLPLGNDLAVLLRIAGSTPAATGGYTLAVDSGDLLQ